MWVPSNRQHSNGSTPSPRCRGAPAYLCHLKLGCLQGSYAPGEAGLPSPPQARAGSCLGGCSRGAWPRVAKGVHTRLPDSIWDALLAAWSTIPGARACHPPPPPVTPRDSGARLSIHLGTNGDQISVLDVYEKIPSALLDRRLRFRARVAQAGGSNTRGVILSFFTLTAPGRYTFGQTHGDLDSWCWKHTGSDWGFMV